MPPGGMFSGAAVGSMWAELQVKRSQFNKDLKEAETQFANTADNIERRANKLGKNLKKAWTGVAAATAGLAASLGGAAAISGKFENALVEVQKVTDPETMRAMKDEIEGMANVIPMAHEELSKLTADAARFGVEGVKNIKSFAETTAMMTTATELAADEAGRQMARLLEWFNIAPKYAQNIGAAVNELSNNMPGDAADIIDALGKTGQAFEVFGASTETAIALSSVIGTLSERAVRGGTRMRRVLQELGEPDKQKKVAEALGMTADEFDRMKEESPVDLLKEIAKVSVQDSKAADKLAQALSSASRTALVVLGNNLDRVNEALEMTGQQLKNPTSLVKEFEAAINTLFKQLRLLWNSVKNVLIVGIGDQAKNALLGFIKNVLRPWVTTIYDILKGNEDLRESIFQLIKAALHIGGVITLVGLAVKMFSALLSTTTLLTAGLLALGAAWRYNAFGIKDLMKEKVLPFIQGVADATAKLVKNLKNLPEDPFGSIKGISKTISESPVEASIPLAIAGFYVSKFLYGSTSAALATALAGGGLGTASGTSLALAKGIGVLVAIPLIINEFSAQNKKKLKKQWEESDAIGKVKAVVENFPVTVLGSLWVSMTWGGLIWSKFAVPAASAIASTAAVHAPWLYSAGSSFAGASLSATTIGLAGIALALSVGTAITAWKKFKTTEKGILQQITEGLISVLGGGALAFGASILGASGAWPLAIGVMGGALIFELTKLIPKWSLGNKKEVEEELEKKANELDVQFGLSAEVYLERIKKLVGDLGLQSNMSAGQISNIASSLSDTRTKKIQKNLQGFLKSLNNSDESLSDFGENIQILVNILERLLTKSKSGEPVTKQKGGPMGMIPGYGGGDRIPALLERGEFVWPKEMVKQYPGVIQGMWEGFSKGGSVRRNQTGYGTTSAGFSTGKGGGNLTGALNSLQQTLRDWIKQPPSWVGDKKTFSGDMKALLSTVSAFEDIQNKVNIVQEEMEKQLKDTNEALEDVEGQSNKVAEAMGISSEQLQKMQGRISTLTSGFMEVAQATGKVSAAQSARLQGLTSAAQSFMSGNWLQGAMDLFTGFMKGRIEDLKKQREEIKKKMNAAYSMMNQAVSQIGQQISNLASGVLGPFGQLLSNSVNALGSFMKMIQAGGDTVEGTTSAFSALLSIATGVIGTFSNLLQKSDAWQQLQDEMEPIWKSLANALGSFLQPIIALVQWVKEYLGIQQQVNDDMKEIVEMNVPSGFKRQRLMWEAINPDEMPTVSGEGGGGGSVPKWAKQIIQPIKKALIPVLDQMKGINIAAWAKNVWTWLSKVLPQKIQQGWNLIQKLIGWWKNNGAAILNKIWNNVLDVYNWFVNNFSSNFSDALSNMDKWLGKTTAGQFLTQLAGINEQLALIAKAMGVRAGALAGGAAGAAIGAMVGGPVGAIIGGGIGALAGGLAGWLGFQEGGIVPGPVGKPMPVIAHGGESITPPGKKVVSTGAGRTGGGERYQFFFNGREMSHEMRKASGTQRYHETGSSSPRDTGRNRR